MNTPTERQADVGVGLIKYKERKVVVFVQLRDDKNRGKQ